MSWLAAHWDAIMTVMNTVGLLVVGSQKASK